MGESVFCYLAEEKRHIQVVRERLRLLDNESDRLLEQDSIPDTTEHVCNHLHRDGEKTIDDFDTEERSWIIQHT